MIHETEGSTGSVEVSTPWLVNAAHSEVLAQATVWAPVTGPAVQVAAPPAASVVAITVLPEGEDMTAAQKPGLGQVKLEMSLRPVEPGTGASGVHVGVGSAGSSEVKT
jgi:hypothetical protein